MFWVIPSFRQNLKEFCAIEGEGPAELKPLITSLKEFYQGIFEMVDQNRNFFVVDSIAIRRELFKLNYLS